MGRIKNGESESEQFFLCVLRKKRLRKRMMTMVLKPRRAGAGGITWGLLKMLVGKSVFGANAHLLRKHSHFK